MIRSIACHFQSADVVKRVFDIDYSRGNLIEFLRDSKRKWFVNLFNLLSYFEKIVGH